MRSRVVLAVAALVGLTGCVEKWTKPGASSEEFDAMKASCTAQAYGQFQPIFQQIQASNGYYTPVTTTCYPTGYGGVSCNQVGGQYIPPIIITVDVNRNARNQATRSCFYSNGWMLAKDAPQVALPATQAATTTAPAHCDASWEDCSSP